MDDKNIEISRLKQIIFIKDYELKEVIKAIERYRKLYSCPVYMKEFNRKVTLDFDDPLYPYCPFRLKKEEIIMFTKQNEQTKNN